MATSINRRNNITTFDVFYVRRENTDSALLPKAGHEQRKFRNCSTFPSKKYYVDMKLKLRVNRLQCCSSKLQTKKRNSEGTASRLSAVNNFNSICRATRFVAQPSLPRNRIVHFISHSITCITFSLNTRKKLTVLISFTAYFSCCQSITTD